MYKRFSLLLPATSHRLSRDVSFSTPGKDVKMSTKSTLMTMSQEVLLMVFLQFYSAAMIHFKKGVVLGLGSDPYYGYQSRRGSAGRHYAPDTLSWVPEELLSPILICKYLRPIAWEAFLRNTLFIFPGQQMTRRTTMRLHSWLDIKLSQDPTDLARRVQSDFHFGDILLGHWTASKNLLPNLKDLSITGKIKIDLQSTYYDRGK